MSTPQPNPTIPLPHLLLRTLQFLTATALAALTIPLTTRVNTIYPLLPTDTAPTSVVLLHALLAIALLTALYTPLPLLAPRLAKSRSLATVITTTNDILLALALFVLATYTDGTLTASLLSLQPSPHSLYIRADGWEPLPGGGDLRPSPPGATVPAPEVAMAVGETELAFLLRMARAVLGLAAGLGGVLVVAAVWGVGRWWRERRRSKRAEEEEEEEARRVEEKRAVVEEVEEV